MIKFTLGKNNLDGLISKLRELDQEQLWSVNITPHKSTRSLSQNEYYWRFLTELADYFGLKSKDEMHEVLLYKLLSTIFTSIIYIYIYKIMGGKNYSI